MGRRAHNEHLIKRDLGEGSSPRFETWCGESGWSGRSVTQDTESRHLCPLCSRLYWSNWLKYGDFPYRLGDALNLAEHKLTHLRSAYPIIRVEDMAMIGVVGIEHGFGTRWQINGIISGYSMKDAEAGREPVARVAGYPLSWTLPPAKPGGYEREREATGYSSKEHALAHVPEHVGAKRLLTMGEVEAGGRVWAERIRIREAPDRRRDEEDRQRRADMLEGLRSIQNRQGRDLTLTNSESEALGDAIAELEKGGR